MPLSGLPGWFFPPTAPQRLSRVQGPDPVTIRTGQTVRHRRKKGVPEFNI
jgi:hypothetical protein